jgi:hypothetical protein
VSSKALAGLGRGVRGIFANEPKLGPRASHGNALCILIPEARLGKNGSRNVTAWLPLYRCDWPDAVMLASLLAPPVQFQR